MQFHLNGFRPGDPGVADDDAALSPVTPMRELPASVDVLTFARVVAATDVTI